MTTFSAGLESSLVEYSDGAPIEVIDACRCACRLALGLALNQYQDDNREKNAVKNLTSIVSCCEVRKTLIRTFD